MSTADSFAKEFAEKFDRLNTINRLKMWGFFINCGLRGQIIEPTLSNCAGYVFGTIGEAIRYEGNRLYATAAGKVLALAMLLFFIRLAANVL